MSARNLKVSFVFVMAVVLCGILCTGALAGEGVVSQQGGVTSFTQPSQGNGAGSAIDYTNAKPMPMPAVDLPPAQAPAGGTEIQREGTPGFEPGSHGDGKLNPTELPLDMNAQMAEIIEAADEITPQEFGTAWHPYTTMRVDLTGNNESKRFPNRAAGKVYFNNQGTTYMCSGSLIKKGIVVTAAHCVAAFGQQRFYSDWQFIPALSGTNAPYGVWNVQNAWVMSSYYYGSDPCYQAGVVCQNDVAVLVLSPQSGLYAGSFTGWLGYGWNGYGFTPNNYALINQLGYPKSHDNGLKMQRTDSQGFVSTWASNTVWGSRQTGGSSGGPELVNLGVKPVLKGTSFGSENDANIVVGVTSWGFVDLDIKQQGASPFTSDNIVSLLSSACTGAPAACQN